MCGVAAFALVILFFGSVCSSSPLLLRRDVPSSVLSPSSFIDWHHSQHERYSSLSRRSTHPGSPLGTLYILRFRPDAPKQTVLELRNSLSSLQTLAPRTYITKLTLSDDRSDLNGWLTRARPFLDILQPLLPNDKTLLEWTHSQTRRTGSESSEYETRVIVQLHEYLHSIDAFLSELGFEDSEISTSFLYGRTDRLVISFMSPLGPKLLDALKSHPNVFFIEPYTQRRELNDEARMRLQGGNPTTPDPLWDEGLTGSGQVVTMMDTGIQSSHCFFHDSSVPNPSRNTNLPSHRKLVRIESIAGDYCDGSSCIGDSNGHGTHVAGTIVGNAEGATTVSDYDGVAHDAKLYVQTFMNSDLSDALQRSYDAGSRIHSNSWGCSSRGWFTCGWDCYCEWDDGNPFGGTPSTEVDSSWCLANLGVSRCCEMCARYSSSTVDVDTFLYDHQEMLVLFAAGNDGRTAEGTTIGSPAVAKSVVTVGAAQCSSDHWVATPQYNNFFNYYSVNDWLPVQSYYPSECCWSGYGDYRLNCCPSYLSSYYPTVTNLYSDSHLAAFSSRGPNLDSRYAVDIVAPGQRVLSSRSNCEIRVHANGTGEYYNQWDTVPYCGVGETTVSQEDGSLILLQGTSMATPAAAGLATLVRQYFTDGYYPTKSPVVENEMATVTGTLLKATLVNMADPSFPDRVLLGDDSLRLSSGFDGVDGLVNNYIGYGFPVAHPYLFYPSTSKMVLVNSYTVEDGDVVRTHCFKANENGARVRATLAYYDLPAAYLASSTLINQVNLLLIKVASSTTSTTSHWGNGGSVRDNKNPTEKIIVDNLNVGDWVCLYLYGTSVDVTDQSVSVSMMVDKMDSGCPPPELEPNTDASTLMAACDTVWDDIAFECVDGVLVTNASRCAGHGTCYGVGGVCVCSDYFDPAVHCSNCIYGYYPPFQCNDWNCSDLSNCNSHGTCSSPQHCDCDTSYSGVACTEKSIDGDGNEGNGASGLSPGGTAALVIVLLLLAAVAVAALLFGVWYYLRLKKKKKSSGKNTESVESVELSESGSSKPLPSLPVVDAEVASLVASLEDTVVRQQSKAAKGTTPQPVTVEVVGSNVEVDSLDRNFPSLPSLESTSSSSAATYRVLFDYEARDPEELSIRKDDVVKVQTEWKGWFYVNRADPEGRGYIPMTFVEEIESQNIASRPSSLSISRSELGEMATESSGTWRVVFDYEAQDDEELSVRVNDVVVVQTEWKDWYYVHRMSDDARGYVPMANCELNEAVDGVEEETVI